MGGSREWRTAVGRAYLVSMIIQLLIECKSMDEYGHVRQKIDSAWRLRPETRRLPCPRHWLWGKLSLRIFLNPVQLIPPALWPVAGQPVLACS